MIDSDKIEELAESAVQSVQDEWYWKMTPRERDLAVKAAKRAACNAVAITLMEETMKEYTR